MWISKTGTINTLAEFRTQKEEEWNKIDRKYHTIMEASLPERIYSVVMVKGGGSKY